MTQTSLPSFIKKPKKVGGVGGFGKPKDWESKIDREKFIKPDGTIDYIALVKEVDELGKKMLDSRIRFRINKLRYELLSKSVGMKIGQVYKD